MRNRRISLIVLLLSLALSIVAAADVARPVNAVTSNSHVITSTGDRYVYESSYQNPGFYSLGLYWVFYEDSAPICEHQGGCFYYKTSSDGIKWSGPNLVTTPNNPGVHVTDSDWSVANSGNQVFYARYNESAFDSNCYRALLYGTGSAGSNGVITWQSEQVVKSPSPTATFPNEVITVDSNSQVWIGYLQDNQIACGGDGHEAPHIIHANNSPLPPAPLGASFIVNASDPIIAQRVGFNATASGGHTPYSYTWNFGDGSGTTGQNVTHSYLGVGTFTATLVTTDTSVPPQISNSSQTIPVGVIPSLNHPPTLIVPPSISAKTGTSITFTVAASDSDPGQSVTVTTGQLPSGASFINSTRQFSWIPTADQSNKTWSISFNATDNGSPALSVTRQMLIYVSPPWTGDISLPNSAGSQSISGNWHVDLATLSGGQVYAAYWADKFYLLGRLYDGTSWGPEENISLTTDSTDVNSFVFASGSTVYAVWFDTNSGMLNAGIRPPGKTWGQYAIGKGEAKSVLGLPGIVCKPLPCHRYSLPFTAAINQAMSPNPQLYVFWYNQTNRVIDEWSGTPGGSWLQSSNATYTQPAADESSIGSFHYSAAVSGGTYAFGLMWIDGTGPSFNLNFGLESVGPANGFQTDSSWNPRVTCIPSVVTIDQILGGQVNPLGGATESGSIFNPGITAKSPGDAKRWLTPGPTPPGWVTNGPPCTITNADGQVVGAFVEIDGVQHGFLTQEDNATHYDPVNGGTTYASSILTAHRFGLNDTTFNIFAPAYNTCTFGNRTGCMHEIHVEFDHDWKAAGYCGPNTVCDPFQLAQQAPADKALIDVQGFVYWDPDHANDPGHAFSGWEIHPLTAWRLSCPQSTGVFCTPGYTLSSNPSALTMIPGQKANSTITINTFNLFSGPVPLTATVTPSGSSTPTATLSPSTVNAPPCNQCGIANSTLAVIALPSSSGTYIVTVTGFIGTPSARTTAITVIVQGFTLSANPQALAVPAGTSVNSTITVSSVGSFSGSVSLNATENGCTCGFVTKFTPATVFVGVGGKQNATLTVTATTPGGSAVITVTGTSASLSSSTTINVTGVDFSVTANPTSSSVLTNRLANSTITVAAINGFKGTVSLTETFPAGLTCSLSPTSILLSSTTTSSTSSLKCNGAVGNYTVIVNGNSNNVIRSAVFTIRIQDFTIAASPTGIMVNIGASGSSTIRVTAVNGFSGIVGLAQNGGAACTLSAPSVSLTSGASSAVVNLACTYTTIGNNNVIVASTGATLSHNATITFQAVDFTIVAAPTSVTVNAGSIGNSTVTLTALNGFNRTVILNVNAPAGLACSLSATKVTLTSLTASTVLSCKSSTANNYSVTVTGANGTLTHTTTIISYRVVDFTGTPNISSLTLLVGATSQALSVQYASLNGFTGNLAINIVITPSGPTATPIFPSVRLTGANNATGIGIGSGQIAGVYTLNITAINGQLSHSVIITLVVQDFKMVPTPALVMPFAGIPGTSVITTSSLNGFSGAVGLSDVISPSTGLTCSLSPSGMTIGGSATTSNSTLSCSGSAGAYTVTITGSGQGIIHNITVNYRVQDFTVGANPTSVTVFLGGGSATSTITVSALQGFTGTVNLTDSISPSIGLTCVLNPASFAFNTTTTSRSSILSCSTGVPTGTFNVTVTGTGNSLSHSVFVKYTVGTAFTVSGNPSSLAVVTGASGTSTISVTYSPTFIGTVTLNDTMSPSTGLTCTLSVTSFTASGNSSLACSGSQGLYKVTVNGSSGGNTASTTVNYQVQDFTISAGPTTVTANAGVVGASTITVAGLNGFNGIVSISSSISPATGLTCSSTPASVTGSGTSSLSCSGGAGAYTVTVTGTSGTLSHSATVTFTVQDFTIAASPTTTTILAGTSGTSTITVTALDGFTGVVSLTSSISPATGLTCTLTPTSVAGSGTSTLSCSGSAGSYTVTVIGTGGTLSHSTTVTYTIQDFTIAASPTGITVLAGTAGISTITVTGLQSFSGVVSLTPTINPASGLTCGLTSTSVTGSGTSTLSCSGSAGSYSVTVTGTSSSLSHSAAVSYTVQDFTVASSPTTVTMNSGATGTSTITITALQGFSGVVSLASSISPATGLTCSLSPTSITGSGTSTLSCSGSAASYAVTLTGTSGTLSHSATVTYAIQDFTVAAAPASLTVNASVAGTSTVTVAPVNGFTGTVALSSSISPATGLTCTLTPSSVNLGTSQASTLSCTGSAGTFTVTVSGTSGSVVRTATVTYTVQDFSITASPASFTVNAGTAASSTITLAALSGFSAVISLTSSISPTTSLTCTLAPTSVTGSGVSTLSCSGGAGAYAVTITGTSGTLAHAATVSYTVQDFTVAANPATLSFPSGGTGTSAITVSARNGFVGTVTLTATNSPSAGLTCTLSPTSIGLGSGTTSGASTLSCTSTTPGTFTVTVSGTGGGLTTSTTVSVNSGAAYTITANPTAITVLAGTAGTSTITVTAQSGFTGTVSLTSSISPSTGLVCTFSPTSLVLGNSGTSTLSCSGSSGIYTVTVIGTNGPNSVPATVSFTSQDFALTASPTTVTSLAGSSGTSTVTITGQNGFGSSVSLTDTISPSTGLTCTLSPTSVVGSGTSSLSCSGSPGAFTVTVTGTSSSLSHSATVSYSVQDFAVVASPTSVSANAGTSGTSTITVTALQGFSGVVSLTATLSPTTGLSCTLTPTSVTGSGTSTLSCTGSAGSYTVTITGTSSSLSHSVTVSYAEKDFTITANPASVAFVAGSSGTSTVTVSAVSGFTGTVILSATVSPTTGLTCTFSPTSLIMGASGTSTLSCSGSAGSYTVTAAGSSSGLSHSVPVVYSTQDYTVTANPTTITANVGAAGTSTITVSAVNGFTGAVSLNADNTACSITPTSVTGSGSATLSCTFAMASSAVVTVTGSSGSQSRTATVSYTIQDFTIAANPTSVTVNAGAPGTSTVTVTGQNGFAGIVNLGTNSTSCAINPTIVTGSGTASLSCNFASPNTIHIGVTGTSGSLSHGVTITFTSQDFSITANPTAVAVNAGSVGTSTITVNSLNGFGAVVNLSSNSTTCTLTPSTVTGSGSASLSCNFTPVSTISVLVTGVSGSLSRTATVTYSVQDFTIAVNPTSVTGSAGSTVTSTITVTGLNGFAGTVSLATNSTSCIATPASLTGSGSSTLSCSSASASIIHVTVTGTSGGLSHSATAAFTVQDFTITVTPTIVTVNAGNSGTSTVTVSAQNGFSGVVGFATNSTVCAASPTSVTGSGSATLSCTFTSAGTIHVQVTGTSSSLSHSLTVLYRVQDFGIGGSPTNVNVNVGLAGTSTITVTAVNGFSGAVSLNTNSTSCSATPGNVAGSGSSTLSCTFSSSSIMHVAVTGTSGSLSRSVTITYTVQDFTVSASPTAVAGVAGSASTSTVTIAPVNGFTSSVAVAVTSNSTSLSCTANPATITGGSGTSTLSCTASLASNYLATVTGTSGGLSHAVSVTYHVQDFSMTTNPASISVTAGTKGSSTITIAPLNGFSGTVLLSQTTNSTDLLCNVNPTSINGGSGTSTLLCTGSAPGNFLASITGTSGVLSHTATVSYAVADFLVSIASSPPVTIGTSATSTITMTGLNGFTGTVSLTDTIPPGLTCGNITPASITGSGTATIACSSTTAGTYTLGITGASGTLSHSASATVKVTDFSMSATSPGAVIASSPATSTISLAYLNGFAGTVGLTDSIPAGLNCGPISPGSLTNSGTASVSCSSNIAGTYTLGITGTSGTLSHSTTASFVIEDFAVDANPTSLTGNVNSALTSTIMISPASGFVDTVTLTVTASSTNISCGLSSTTITGGSGSSTLSCTASLPGSYTVTVKGADGLLSHTATVTFSIAVPDFSISASPSGLTTSAGSTTTSTITVSSVNGFVGIVQLSSSISPPTGLSCTLTPTSVTLGTSGTSTLSCSGSAGGYTVTVTGTPTATAPHSTTVGVTVQDFTVNDTPTSVTVNAGAMGISTVVVTNVLGFTGTVNLAATISPSSGLTCTLAPTSVTLGNTGTSTLTCTGSSGRYTVTITGTSGSLTRTSTVNYTVQDFTTTTSQTNVTALASASGTSTITVTAVQSLTGTVSLSTTSSPSTGLTCTVSPTSVTLTGTASSGTSTLSCSGTAGSYTVTITGSDGNLSHNAIVTFTVQDFSVTANPASVAVSSGSAGTSTITVSGFDGFSGTVSLTPVVSPSTGLTCTLSPTSVALGAVTSGISTLSCTGTLGTYTVTVTGSGSSLSHTASLTYTVQDFAVSASPTGVLVFSGASGTSTLTVSSANGFTGTVNLTDNILPSSGLTCTLGSASITLTTASSSGTSTLSCTPSVTSTTFTVTVTGASGGLTRSAAVTYNVGTAFSMTANPTSVTDVAGSSGSSTITIAYAPGFSGTVILSNAVSPTSGLSCALATTSLTSSGTSTLSCSGQAGFYTVTVTATNGANSASATVTFTVQDFGLTTTSTSVTTLSGAAGSTTVIATGLDGFVGNVALSATVSPSNGMNCNLTPSVLSLSATASSATSSLSCSGTAGSYAVTVTGTSSGLTHSVSVSYTVQDFTVATSPTSVTVLTGATGTSGITITGLQGFAGTISLSVAISPPSGLVCVPSPTTVSLAASTTTGQSTLSCSGSAGLYAVTITGTSSGLSHGATLTVAVQDYTVVASPTSLSVVSGAFGSSTITVTGLQGFSGTISLSAATSPPTGLTCTFSPASVVLSIANPSTTSTLSCSGSAGSYTVTATGTGGSLTHSATVAVIVQDFALAVSQSTVTVNTGVGGSSTVIVTPTQGFTGTVALANGVSPASGLTCTISPTTVTLGPSGTSALICSGLAGTYTVSVTGTSGALSHSASVTYVVQDFAIAANPTSVAMNVNQVGTSTITISAVNGFTGAVSLTNTISTNGMTCILNPTSVTGSGTSTLSCTATTSGTFTVTVKGTSGALSHSSTVSYSVAVPDFSITAVLTSVSVNAGIAGTSAITVTSINGFTGTVGLISSVSPSTGLSCTLTPTSVTLGASGTSDLSCTGSAGTYTVTVTGSNGILSHSAPVTYTIQDFTVTSGPSSVTVNAGTSGTSTITITALPALQGFTGVVTVAATASPSTGLICTLTPTSVTLGGSATSTLSCNGSSGVYTVTVTGASNGLSHSATVSYTVQDFTVAAAPTTVSVLAGLASTSTITVVAQQGFSGLVGLTSNVSPVTGLACTLTPTSFTGSGTAVLSCSGSVGTYGVTVTGTSGSLSHSATVTFTVTDFTLIGSPTSVTLNAGTPGISTISVAANNGFAGVVNLSTNSTSCTVSPTSVTGSGSATLSCDFSAASTVHVTLTGTSGSRSHPTTVTYIVQDFTIGANPATVSVVVGIAGNSTITVAGLNGFVGVVALTATASPSTGISCTLFPNSIAGSGTSTISCPTTASGIYTITITSTSGSTSHPMTITISVGMATTSITTSLSTSTILVGSSVTDSTRMTGGFNMAGTVTYEYFAGSTCSGTPTTVGAPVVVTSGMVPNSASQRFNSAGSFSWEAIYSGDSNNAGATSPCEPLTVNSPPTLSIPGAQTVTAGATVHFVVNATDGLKTVTLTASGLPSGAIFSSTQSFAGGASSIFSWTPSDAQAPGDYTVTFTAQDTQGVSTVSHVTIHVSPLSRGSNLPILSYSLFGIVGFLAIVVVALVLRKIQNPRRKP